jgi:hypothetical protein
LITSDANGGVPTVNGITVQVTGSSGGINYNPNVVNVAAPTLTGHQLQAAVDAAPARSLLVLKPGTYNENVVVWKPLKIQGVGPGGATSSRTRLRTTPRSPPTARTPTPHIRYCVAPTSPWSRRQRRRTTWPVRRPRSTRRSSTGPGSTVSH